MADVGCDPELAKAHARLIADTSTQFELPRFVAPEIPSWIKPTGEFFTWLMPAFPYIFWGAVALVVAMVAWLIFNEARGMAFRWPWQRKPEAEEEQDWSGAQSDRKSTRLNSSHSTLSRMPSSA